MPCSGFDLVDGGVAGRPRGFGIFEDDFLEVGTQVVSLRFAPHYRLRNSNAAEAQ